jgi:PTH1 family peptidyl-tRNA hydrolase
MVLDHLAERSGARFSAFRSRADVASVPRFAGRSNTRVILAKPRSYMNESGGPVAAVRSYYRVPLDRLIVVHDELDLPYGSLRLKQGGGDSGHNGLRSLTRSLGGPDYLRVRFGIGRPPGRMDPAAFVLKDFTSTERAELALGVDRAADAVEAVVTQGLAKAQNLFHATRYPTD